MITTIPDRSDKKAFELYRHGVTMGFIEGREVYYRPANLGAPWMPRVESMKGEPLDWRSNDYCFAPEAPKVVPWTFETAPDRVKVRRKADGKLGVANLVPYGFSVHFTFYSANNSLLLFGQLADQFEQLDGTPCGTLKASEWPKFFTHADVPYFGGDIAYIEYASSGPSGVQVRPNGARVCVHESWRGYSAALHHVKLGNWKQITPAEAEALIQKARAK